ncbi:MAG: hypothetical protein ACPLZD_03205 [Candidatus Saccharicenans sp.]
MKKQLFSSIIFSLIFLFFTTVVIFAQENDQSKLERNIRENIFTLRALRMTQALELTQEQTAVIFPELSRAEKDKAGWQHELAEEIKNLRQMVKENKASAEEYENEISKIRELRKKIQAREQTFEEFLFKQLTPVQKAKYIIFNLDFNRGLMERMNRARMLGSKMK